MFKVIAAGLIGFGTAIVVIGCALTNEKLRKDFIDEISKKDNKIDDIKDDIIDVAEAAEELPEEIVEAAEEVVDKVTTEFGESMDRIKDKLEK